MHETLIAYLNDNKYQILEVWLTEVDLMPPTDSEVEQGGLPIVYLEGVFKDVIRVLRGCDIGKLTGVHQLNEYMGQTFECKTDYPQTFACFEILLAGNSAFASVLNSEWDASGEFSEEEYETYSHLIKKALAIVMHLEVQKCASCAGLESCPFNAMKV